MKNSPESVCLRINDWLCDLSSYQIGDTFKGTVSYVLDGEKKLCFVRDVSRFVTQIFSISIIVVGNCAIWFPFSSPIPFDRQANVDFKDYLESAFKTVPAYGYMFAAELNQKFFRVIRIDSEVSWKSISMARFVSITAFLSFSHNDNTFNDLWIVFRIGIEYGIPCSPDWYWWNGSSITKCVEIQFEWTGKAASTAGNSLLRWKGMTMHFLFVFEFECFRE